MNQRARIIDDHAVPVSDAVHLPAFKLAYRVDEAVIATGLSRSTIYRHIKAGELRTKKDGNTSLILTAELERFLNALPEGEIKR